MKTVRQLLAYMNDVDYVYVVLRNFENLPDNVVVGEHSDLDLLVYDREHWEEVITEAERCYPSPRVRYKVPIGKSYIYVDVRSVEDGYYPQEFAEQILDTREWQSCGFYTPNPQMFRISLAYHAVHHKDSNNYKRWLGDVTVKELLEALKESNINWVPPEDPTVGQFHPYWKGATAVVSKKGDKIVKEQVSFKKWDLLENEYRILTQLDSIHFPKVKKLADGKIELEDCGVPLTVDNLPANWRAQLVNIVYELKRYDLVHRDIKPDNLMIKDGTIKLIDFGWSRFRTDSVDEPPLCLGHPYKPSWGYDDNFSMKKVYKEFEYQLEEVECVSLA